LAAAGELPWSINPQAKVELRRRRPSQGAAAKRGLSRGGWNINNRAVDGRCLSASDFGRLSMLRNAVLIATDDGLLAPAIWLWQKLRAINPRADTDILLVSEKRREQVWGEVVPEGLSIAGAELPLPDIDLPTDRRIPRASYWKIAAPAHLRGRYRRMLYVDVDVLPLSDRLFECFDYDMGGAPVAACQQAQNQNPMERRNGRVVDGKLEFDRYFNAGVLLVDIETYCQQGVDRRTYHIIENQRSLISLHDQSALNLALSGTWKELSMSFNFWPGALGTFLEERRPPWLLHYYGDHKPWHMATPYVSPPVRNELLAALWVRDRAFFMRDRGRWNSRRQVSPAYLNPENELLAAYLEAEALGVPSD
jgi:Glycosyl transferase family 8